MIDLEKEGFIKIEWDEEKKIPTPLPVPNVPYWGANTANSSTYLFSMVWHPNYDGQGNGGFLMLEDVDAYVTKDGKWAWDMTIEDVRTMPSYVFRPYTDITHIKRIPSPLSDDNNITYAL
jgi:hypothetical protein